MFSALWDFLVRIYAALALVPFVSFFLFWGIGYLFLKNRKQAQQLAMDITTLLLIGVVSAGFDNAFPNAVGGFWLIALFMLLLAGLIGNAQNRLRGKVDGRRLIRAVWRIGFVVLSVAYIVLVLIGIIRYWLNA